MIDIVFTALLLAAALALFVVVIHPDIQTGVIVTTGLLLLIVSMLAALDAAVNWRNAFLAAATGLLMVSAGFLIQWRRVHRGRKLATCRRAEDQVKVFLTPGR